MTFFANKGIKCPKFKNIKVLPTVGDPRQPFHGSSATRTCTTAEKSLSYGWGKCVFICRLAGPRAQHGFGFEVLLNDVQEV